MSERTRETEDRNYHLVVDLSDRRLGPIPPEEMEKRKRTPRAKQDRVPLDAYPTDPALARAIVDRLSVLLPAPRRIVEPSAGGGGFVLACRERWPTAHIAAVELRSECARALKSAGATEVWIGNFTELAGQVCGAADLVVGNPPYRLAEAHFAALWPVLKPGASVAWLLRLGFLAGVERQATIFADRSLRLLAAITPRPSFSGDNRTDASEYADMVWTKGWTEGGRIDPAIRWERAK